MQNFSDNGYEVCWSKPANVHHDEAVAAIVDQFVSHNMYAEVVSGDNDDSVEAALGL